MCKVKVYKNVEYSGKCCILRGVKMLRQNIVLKRVGESIMHFISKLNDSKIVEVEDD